jgi:hypothetical protein
MSIEALKQTIAEMDSDGRHEILAYILSLDDQSNAAYRESLARKIDDKDPANWLTMEEIDRRLSIQPDEKSG